jgi:hypothetical protein
MGRSVFERVRATQSPSVEGDQDPYALGKIMNKHAEVAQAYADADPRSHRQLEKAVGLRPGFADLHVKLGSLLRDRGDLPAALAAFEQAAANPAPMPGAARHHSHDAGPESGRTETLSRRRSSSTRITK